MKIDIDGHGAVAELVRDQLEPGTSVLVSGPVHGGQLPLCFDILTTNYDDSVGSVFISTDLRSQVVFDEFEQRVDEYETSQCRIIDARGDQSGRQGPQSGAVTSVSSPSDLTGIGIETVRGVNALERRGSDTIFLGIHSISTLTQYLDVTLVFKFLHTLTGRCAATGITCVGTLNSPIHSERVVSLITSVFDVHVQIRETDEGREVRIFGLETGPTEWLVVEDVE